ncbi:MAG: OmpA family protein, partial [Chitinophagales bacterium]
DIMMGQNKDLALKPGVLVRYVPNIPIQFDGSLLFDYKNIFWVGGGYRYKNVGVFGMAGVRLFDMVSVGYAYEQSIDGNQGALGSTHEFNLGLRFKTKGNKQEKAIENYKDDYADIFNAKLDSMKQEQKQLEAESEAAKEELRKQKAKQQELEEKLSNLPEATTTNITFSEDYINNFDLTGQVQFEKNASNLYPSHKQQLDGIYNQIKPLVAEQKLVMIHLVGSASVEGDEDYNLILSNKRVENVRQYLIEKGVPEKLISSTFKGNSEGVVKNNIEDFTKDKVSADMINPDDRTVKIYMLTK